MASTALQKKNISFKRVSDMTLGELFGTKPVAATSLMGTLWTLIKKKKLKSDD